MNSSGEYRQVRQRNAIFWAAAIAGVSAFAAWVVPKFLDGTSEAAVIQERVNNTTVQVKRNTEVLGVVKETQTRMLADMEYLKVGVRRLVEAEDERQRAADRRRKR